MNVEEAIEKLIKDREEGVLIHTYNWDSTISTGTVSSTSNLTVDELSEAEQEKIKTAKFLRFETLKPFTFEVVFSSAAVDTKTNVALCIEKKSYYDYYGKLFEITFTAPSSSSDGLTKSITIPEGVVLSDKILPYKPAYANGGGVDFNDKAWIVYPNTINTSNYYTYSLALTLVLLTDIYKGTASSTLSAGAIGLYAYY
jgi:hypothetical protein